VCNRLCRDDIFKPFHEHGHGLAISARSFADIGRNLLWRRACFGIAEHV
jgi:hypothetical protein